MGHTQYAVYWVKQRISRSIADNSRGICLSAHVHTMPEIFEKLVSSLATAANEASGLAMDSIAAAQSGHMGLPLETAELGAILYGKQMQYNAADPKWINPGRFVLSAGLGSMFVYSWLNLAGFDVPMDKVKIFGQHHSRTLSHPGFPNSKHNTPGIECTIGPLGQDVANARNF